MPGAGTLPFPGDDSTFRHQRLSACRRARKQSTDGAVKAAFLCHLNAPGEGSAKEIRGPQARSSAEALPPLSPQFLKAGGLEPLDEPGIHHCASPAT